MRHGIAIFHNLKLLMIDQEVNLHYLRETIESHIARPALFAREDPSVTRRREAVTGRADTDETRGRNARAAWRRYGPDHRRRGGIAHAHHWLCLRPEQAGRPVVGADLQGLQAG